MLFTSHVRSNPHSIAGKGSLNVLKSHSRGDVGLRCTQGNDIASVVELVGLELGGRWDFGTISLDYLSVDNQAGSREHKQNNEQYRPPIEELV
jgi:hypothetical protein